MWDSVCHAWSESHRFVRAKVWDSWDWRESQDKVTKDTFRFAVVFVLMQSPLTVPCLSNDQLVVLRAREHVVV